MRDQKRALRYNGASAHDEVATEIDAQDGWPTVQGVVVVPNNVAWEGGWLNLSELTVVAAFNGEIMETCGRLCRGMNKDQLKFLRTHLTKLRDQKAGQVGKEKWSALNKERAGRERQHRDKCSGHGEGPAWGGVVISGGQGFPGKKGLTRSVVMDIRTVLPGTARLGSVISKSTGGT